LDLRNFDLRDILQENNPGVQWDLPVLQTSEIRQCVGLWISTNSVEECAIFTSKIKDPSKSPRNDNLKKYHFVHTSNLWNIQQSTMYHNPQNVTEIKVHTASYYTENSATYL
jgi:hypothetical protein